MSAFADFVRAVEAKTGRGGRLVSGQTRLLCPAHNDHDPSLDVKEGADGRPLVQCRSHGCTFEAICQALGREPRDFLPSSDGEWTPKGPAVAVYPYTDEEGRLLFEVCRTADKQFPQRRPDASAKSGWRWNLTGVDRVLYRLPAVLCAVAAGELVYVAEGEKDVEALERSGAVATCNPEGAGKWKPRYSDALRGARVVVVADNDTAGLDHARKVVASLRRTGVAVERVVRAREGKDVADHLAAGRRLEELEEFELPVETKEPAPFEPREKEPPQATALVRHASELYTFGCTPAGEPFGIPKGGARIARPLRGGRDSLRTELARAYMKERGQAPSASALADALLTLEGQALAGDECELSLRVARQGSELVLDLGRKDGTAIILGAGGWRCVEGAPAPLLFRRTALTAGLPTPVGGGSLDELRELVNIADRDWPLVVGWLVASLVPDIAHPILWLTGVKGAAKSTAARLLALLLDASPAPLRAPPRDPNDWGVSAAGSWIVPLDNISKIPEWLADAMCRAVTGDGLVRRALFTDSDLAVLSYRRVLVLTTIDAGALSGDLADRLLPVELERIPPESRRTDDDIATHFREAHPRILGALLDLAAKVLEALPGVELPGLPRMADAGRVFAALDAVLGTEAFATYLELGAQLASDVVDDDDVARVIRAYVGEHGALEGTAAECLEYLTPESAPKGWPASPRALAGRFRRIAPALREVGIAVSWDREAHTGRRLYRVLPTEGEGSRPSPPSPPSLFALEAGFEGDGQGDGRADPPQPSPEPSPQIPLNQARGDGGDGGDGSTPSLSEASEKRDPLGTRQRVRELKAQGLDASAIAGAIGRSEQWVSRALEESGQ